jgi:hypothetical protein
MLNAISGLRLSFPRPTPKAFGAALPTELPTHAKYDFSIAPEFSKTNPESLRGCSGLLYRLSYQPW